MGCTFLLNLRKKVKLLYLLFFHMKAISVYRANALLFFGFLIFTALYFAKSFFIPFTVGILLAMMVLPICKRLENWGVNRGISIFLCILLILLIVAGMIGLLSAQVVSFMEDIPKIQTKLENQIAAMQLWVENKYNIPPEQQTSFFKDNIGSFAKEAGTFAKKLVSGTIGGLTTFLLILVYIFFFLFYREKYEKFFLKLRGENNSQEVKQVIAEITDVSVQYISGRFRAILILAVLNSVAFLIIGVKYAILLGCIAALFTFIPYVGTIIGGVFAAGTALVTKSASAALAVIGTIAFIQLIDDYFIEPYVVGGEVDLSPLAIIVILVIGGLLWGVAGMILFIPLLGIVKIIFDHVPSLQPYGYLIGDDSQSSGPSLKDKIKKWFKKDKQVA
jgi:predicted PurR-regulated permease PerM